MSNKARIKKHRTSRPSNDRPLATYEIGNDAVIDQKYLNLPQNVRDELNALYDLLATKPKKAIPRLEQLKEEYPKVPSIYNYLSVAYSFTDKEKHTAFIQENYRQNPKNLFARCHYAQLCLEQGRPEKIPQIFEDKYDLKSLYPRRNRFQPSEFTSFVLVLCLYYVAVGKRKQAEEFYEALKQFAPNSMEAKQAKKALNPGLLKRAGQKLASLLAK
ncbi:MAG: hypothetical protein ACU833_13385 [Gammaproteobacteria bacterium]